MSNIDWFNFENKDYDFPFYKHNPRISKLGWIVLFFALFVGLFLQVIPQSELLGGLLFCAVPLIAVLYYLRWDIKAIIRKPKAKEVGLAVLLFVCYIIYTMGADPILSMLGLVETPPMDSNTITIFSFIPLIFIVFGEEFLKFIPFVFFLRLIYKYSNNRKLSVIMSMLIIMLFFGLIHAMDVNSIIPAIIVQGIGSIFELYGYVKTKNILIPFITHLCTDMFIYAIVLLGL